MSHPERSASPRPRKNPLTRLLDTVGSIWFGVTMLVIIFIYSSIGSAYPPARQGQLADLTGLEFLRFDKSEMEWFSWWPFVLMIVLFCLAIIIVTLRRIPLTLVNAGVWTIHTGIVIMAGACLYYFGTKVEGDTVIFGTLARIRAPGVQEATLVVRPSAQTMLSGPDRQYMLQVANIEPEYRPQAGRFANQRMQRISFNVRGLHDGTAFMRRMVVGDTSSVEDFVASPGGMTRSPGLVDPNLQIVLDYDPVEYFYHSHELPVRSNGAIYVRPVGQREWTELRVDWLPHYNERLTNRSELWPTEGQPLPPVRHLDQVARKPEGVDWLKGLEFRVTDYLPFARIESRHVQAGPDAPPNPLIRFRLGNDPRTKSQELLAADHDRNQVPLMEGFSARFVWVGSPAERADLTRTRDPRIKVKVESKGIEKEIKLSAFTAPTPLEGTEYTLELSKTYGPGELQAHSKGIAIVRVTKGATRFDRVVFAEDAGGGKDLDKLAEAPADPDIKFEYLDPLFPGVLLVAGPDSKQVDVVVAFRDGRQNHYPASVGQTLPVFPMAGLTIEELLSSVRQETRPAIVPKAQRATLQGKHDSLIRLEVSDGRRIQGVWLEFNDYVFPDAQRNQPGRIKPYSTEPVLLSNGQRLEVMYSRQREKLASRVALDRFKLDTHTGGDRPADFISWVRFEDKNAKDGWSDPVEIRSNQPARHGDYWYFQSRWDPNTEAHTVLGVGNRNGVVAMLAGVCISIAGMIYAFYVKPAIIRKRKRDALELAAIRLTGSAKSNGSAESKRPAPSPAGEKQEVTRV